MTSFRIQKKEKKKKIPRRHLRLVFQMWWMASQLKWCWCCRWTAHNKEKHIGRNEMGRWWHIVSDHRQHQKERKNLPKTHTEEELGPVYTPVVKPSTPFRLCGILYHALAERRQTRREPEKAVTLVLIRFGDFGIICSVWFSAAFLWKKEGRWVCNSIASFDCPLDLINQSPIIWSAGASCEIDSICLDCRWLGWRLE